MSGRVRAWAWWLLAAAAAGARELDPAACSARFDVQRDKIIRTEESREMGARYLSELDVGARHECLRLCCETDACDVFVYEEKGPGSCYLFNCGPPEDFRCKFTAHSNFSSGVLALSRRLAELQDQEQRAHRERELASLRSATSTTPSTTTATPAPPPRPAHTPEPRPPAPRGCSRYQFECRRGGECIAVYNACDGVPQCADGSDEAPELGCPPPAPAPRPPPVPTRAPLAPLAPLDPALKPLQLQESMEVGAGGEGPPLSPAEDPAADHWPHRLTQAQPQHRYNEGGGGSHIFSHKGGLLQEPLEPPPAPAPAPAPAAWPRRLWAQHQTGLEGMSGWLGGGGGGGEYPRAEWPEPDPRRAWPVPQPRPDQEMSVYIPSKTMPEIPMVYSSQQQTLRDSAKKGFDLSERADTAPAPALAAAPAPAPASREQHVPSPAPAPRQDVDRREEAKVIESENTTKKKFIPEKNLDGIKPAEGPGAESAGGAGGAGGAAAARRRAGERDGLSERPPAAVLLLVLGVLMTTVMGAMLACRARAARRRMRRGKSPFAHDADYLVNGMYL